MDPNPILSRTSLSGSFLGQWLILVIVLEAQDVSPLEAWYSAVPSMSLWAEGRSPGCSWGSYANARDLPCLAAPHVFKITVPISC